MTKAGNSQIMRTITLLITIFSLSLPAYARYDGGMGEPNTPYQIATAEDQSAAAKKPAPPQKLPMPRRERLSPSVDLASSDRPILLESGPITAQARRAKREGSRDVEVKLSSEIAKTIERMGVRQDERVPYLVMVRGPHVSDTKRKIESVGGKVWEYIQYYTFIVEMSASVRGAVAGLDDVTWVEVLKPEYRVSRTLQERIKAFREATTTTNPAPTGGYLKSPLQSSVSAGGSENHVRLAGLNSLPLSPTANIHVMIYFYSKDGLEEARDLIEQGEGSVVRTVENGSILKIQAEVPFSDVENLAAISGVRIIYPHDDPVLLNDQAAAITGAPFLWDTHGLTGFGQIIGHADTGLDVGTIDSTMSDDFVGRIIAAFPLGRTGGDWSDFDGHGTHTAGSILGDGTNSEGMYKGIAYEASIVHQSIMAADGSLDGLPLDYGDLFSQAYDAGARIHSNSWGSGSSGEYGRSLELDMWAWNSGAPRDMLIVVGAGNHGPDRASIKIPGTAKNCLTVGASENYRPYCGDEASEPSEIAEFSSRGYTSDGRVKPDLLAPGTWIASVKTQAGIDQWSDDMEGGVNGWSETPAVTPWQQSTSDARSGSTSWHYNRPPTSYFDDYLISPVITPMSTRRAVASFYWKGNIPPRFELQIKIRGPGEGWGTFGYLQGDSPNWQNVALDIPIELFGLAFSHHRIPTGTPWQYTHADASDIDDDGDSDFAVVINSNMGFLGSVYWLENDGSGNFTHHILMEDLEHASGVWVGDLDGDTDIDIIGGTLEYAGSDHYWWENDGEENFTSHVLTIGPQRGHIVGIADIDRDGDADLHGFAPSGWSSVIWWENDGSEEYFTSHAIRVAVTDPADARIVDMDEDGDFDFVAVEDWSANGDVAWYENDGAGIFQEHVLGRTFPDGEAICPADLDGDGDIDLILGGEGEVALFSNLGNGEFSYRPLTRQTGARVIEASDLDRDGDMDLVISTDNAFVGWLENDGAGSFIHHWVTSGGPYPVPVLEVLDVDGDEDPDLVLSLDSLNWYENLGVPRSLQLGFFSSDGSPFDPKPEVDMDVYIDDVTISTFSSDGSMSTYGLASLGDEIDQNYTLMSGTSSAAAFAAGAAALVRQYFEESGLINPSAELVKATLINGATKLATSIQRPNAVQGWGHLDLENSLCPTDANRLGYFDQKDGIEETLVDLFDVEVTSTEQDLKATLVWCDPEGPSLQNDLDLVLVSPSQTEYYPNGDSIFFRQYVACLDRINQIGRMIPADLDYDGDIDLVGDQCWFENDGSGRLTYTYVYEMGEAFDVVDMDNDGDLDTVGLFGIFDSIIWCEHTSGAEPFSTKTKHTVEEDAGRDINTLLACDLNGDGSLDLMFSEGNYDGHYVSPKTFNLGWWEWVDKDTFIKHTIQSGPGDIFGYPVDWDDNGTIDILCSVYSEDSSSSEVSLICWLNDGSGTFSSKTLAQNLTAYILPADIDNDGDMDIVSSKKDVGLLWLKNDGNDSLTSHIFGDYAEVFVLVDMDRNGAMDVLARHGDEIQWYENNGKGDFVSHIVSSRAPYPSSKNKIRGTDLTGDGLPDVVASYDGEDEYSTTCWENTGKQDRTNNVELVEVPSPQLGTWKIRIEGTTVPRGPQPYALVFSGAFSSK